MQRLQTFTTFYCHVFTFLTFCYFFFWGGERYVRMFVQHQKHLVQKLLRLQVSSLRCGVVFQLHISTSDA